MTHANAAGQLVHQRAADSAALLAGTDLGAYRIVRCVATGGMGAVYEAEHRALRKRVAIKTPLAEAGTSPEGRARFVQEGKTASKLRHPHVVSKPRAWHPGRRPHCSGTVSHLR